MTTIKDKEEKENYSSFLRYIEEEKKETSTFAKILLIFVLIIFILVACLFLSIEDQKTIVKIFGKDSIITKKLSLLIENKDNRRKKEFILPFFPRTQNILLLGVDSNGSNTDSWKGTRSDTIVLLNVDGKTRSINALSIPRDSKVYLPGEYGIQKINAAHALGGVELTKETIEQTLGINIDKYIVINDEAVKKIVDSLGGIPIYVEKRMHYNDYAGSLYINLDKGLNILNGDDAVGYLRFRHDGLGDIGRTQRQQWFLRGLLKKIQSPHSISKIPEMLNIASSYIKTNLSLYEISQYAALAKSFDINKIQVATLPGAPNKKGTTSYWILDPEKTQEVINRLIYRDKPRFSGNKELKAGIMYSPEKENEAIQLKDQLQELGFEVNCFGKDRLPHSQFIVNSSSISNDFFLWLKKKIPEIKHNQFVYDPNNFYCSSSDFVVIMSGQ